MLRNSKKGIIVYLVNEFFQTMQGEGFYTGTPAFFIRLQGCDVGCKFCDTKYTWSLRTKSVKPDELKPDSPQHAQMTSEDIYNRVGITRHVVITGGEPCIFDLRPLTDLLENKGIQTQIETSATQEIKTNEKTWVTLSPKFNNPNKKPILKSCLERANEFKFPIASQIDLKFLDEFFEQNDRKDRLVWLQPISQGEEATRVCLEEARKRGWRISVQTHKYIGLR